jgi:ribosomal protein S18 acetylase RimI-like enzyme
VLPDRVLELYDEVSARDLWQRSFAGAGEGREILVAEQPDHTIAGVAMVGEDPDRPRTGHVFSLYVHPRAQGQGVGTRLLSAAVERLQALGFSEASLWVFEANVRGRALYERLGWRADGASRVEPEYGQPESRLTRSLAG